MILLPFPIKEVHTEEQPVKLHSPQGKTQIIIVHMDVYGKNIPCLLCLCKIGLKM